MPKRIDIIISESVEFLEKTLAKTKEPLKKDRIKILLFVKTGKYLFKSDIAKKLGRHQCTIKKWLDDYSSSSMREFIKVKSGGNNTKKISERMINFIDEKLTNPKSNITSYLELKVILEEELNTTIPYTTLYSHCKRKYKSKLKVARKSHHKKDADSEAFFKKPKIEIRRD
jgi:transposase